MRHLFIILSIQFIERRRQINRMLCRCAHYYRRPTRFSKYDVLLSFCLLRGRGVVGVVTIIAITIRIVITAGYKIQFLFLFFQQYYLQSLN